MVIIETRANANNTKDYYALDDAGERCPVEWGGLCAGRHGLAGVERDRKHFNRLIDNRDAATGKDRLTPVNNANRRDSYDISLHSVKSVSLAAELAPPVYRAEIVNAFKEAVWETLTRDAEPLAAERVRRGGRDEDRITGNWTVAMHWHDLARPVSGVSLPHRHAHAVIPNHTWSPEEGRFKALQMGLVKQNAPMIQKQFLGRLRGKLERLGYATVDTKTGWELAAVPKSAIRKMSERRELIQKVAKRLKATPREQGRLLGLKTREKKGTLAKEELRKEWVSRLTQPELACFRRLKQKPLPSLVQRARQRVAFLMKQPMIEPAMERTLDQQKGYEWGR